jgi:hypothetical protein
MIKKLDSSKIKQWEKPKPQDKNFKPVPDKYYVEDEGLAKAAGGGLRAFEEQERRVEELQREQEDARLARMIQSHDSMAGPKATPRPPSEIDPESLNLIKQLQTEESKTDQIEQSPGQNSPVAPAGPNKINLREEIVKTVVELKGVCPQLDYTEFLTFAKENVILAPYSKPFPPKRVEEMTKEVVDDLYPPLQVPKRYGFCCA